MLTGRDFKLAGKGLEAQEESKAIKKLEQVIPQSLRENGVYDPNKYIQFHKGILKGLAARMSKHELDI